MGPGNLVGSGAALDQTSRAQQALELGNAAAEKVRAEKDLWPALGRGDTHGPTFGDQSTRPDINACGLPRLQRLSALCTHTIPSRPCPCPPCWRLASSGFLALPFTNQSPFIPSPYRLSSSPPVYSAQLPLSPRLHAHPPRLPIRT